MCYYNIVDLKGESEMQLYILDKDPKEAVNKLPEKYRFKMLIELAQMVSTITGCGTYKPIKQGKEIQEWIKKHPNWILDYQWELMLWCDIYINMSKITEDRLNTIFNTFKYRYRPYVKIDNPKEAVFRYNSKYKCEYPSNSSLPIDICVSEYNKYLEWKLG